MSFISNDFSLVADTEGTFSVARNAGNRHPETDLESGGGGDLTVTMSGPVIAYGYSF